jgi:hypothetical protein
MPGIVSTTIIFSFMYMCTQYLHHIHPPSPFFHLLLLPLVPSPQARSVLPSWSLVLFKKKKKITFFVV